MTSQRFVYYTPSFAPLYFTDTFLPIFSNQHDHPKIIHGAIHALHRVFAPLLSKGDLQRPKKSPTPDDKKATVTVWLRDNYVRYLNRLCKLLQHDEPGLQVFILSFFFPPSFSPSFSWLDH